MQAVPKATIKEVAAEAGVSTATVSRVLNDSGYVSPEVKERVRAAMGKLRYRPSAIARSLKQDRTHMIGVLVPDISNPYFMEMSRGIEDVAGQEGFQLTFCSSDENPDKEKRLLQLLGEKRVDAIVLATAGGGADTVHALAEHGIPVVLIDRRLEGKGGKREFDLVAEDNSEGAYRLAMRLLEDGHTRIGIVNGPAHATTGRDRLGGVMKALREHGLDGKPPVYNGDFSTEGGIRAVKAFLQEQPRPTAILSLNNRMSFGVLVELVRSGLRIPDDMAVASFGEVEAGRLLRSPGLIYIYQRPYDMGRRAGELLLERIQGAEPQRRAVKEIFSNEVKRMD